MNFEQPSIPSPEKKKELPLDDFLELVEKARHAISKKNAYLKDELEDVLNDFRAGRVSEERFRKGAWDAMQAAALEDFIYDFYKSKGLVEDMKLEGYKDVGE